MFPEEYLLLKQSLFSRIDAVGRIRMLLIDAEHAEAVSLYRAARFIVLCIYFAAYSCM